MEDISERIRKMIVERLMLSIGSDEISDDDDLMEEFDIDSVLLFELVIGTEEEFDISFEDEEFSVDSFKTVQAISQTVQKKLDTE